jgi:hypothetical protein
MREKTLKKKIRNQARNLCANLQKSGDHCIKYNMPCPLAKKEIVHCSYYEKAVLPDNNILEKEYKSYMAKNKITKTVGDVYDKKNN